MEASSKETIQQDSMMESERDFNIHSILQEIKDVTNWKDLGLQLGFPSSKLNKFELEQDPIVALIQGWMDGQALPPSWETLEEALTSPAMCENRVAKGIAVR